MDNNGQSPDPAPASAPPPGTRRHFALIGPRRPIDPATSAIRPDLADIRLAEYVFAPHYAAPMGMVVTTAAPLRAGPGEDAPVITGLNRGDLFEALDINRGYAWGKAVGCDLVGYVANSVLTLPGEAD